MEIKDLAGLSTPLTKLIEVVSSGIGNISKPILTRKNADAKAYEIERIARAICASQKLIGNAEYKSGEISIESGAECHQHDTEQLIENRVLDRCYYQETKKQHNIEEITCVAAEELTNEQDDDVSNEKIDEDWVNRFFRIAEDISSEHMQILWGRVLAGEVKKPGSYSLRTLEVLKNITTEEAAIFSKLANLCLYQQNDAFVLNPEEYKYLSENFGIDYDEILLLREIGLLADNDFLHLNFNSNDIDNKVIFKYGNLAIWAEVPSGKKLPKIPIIIFTKSGVELSRLIQITPVEKYSQKFASMLKSDTIKIKCGVIKSKVSNGFMLASTIEM